MSDSKNKYDVYLHYDNGEIVNIRDLKKEQYEEFLENMNKVRLAYLTIKNNKLSKN